MLQWALLAIVLCITACQYLTDPLRKVPGPILYRLTKWRLAFDDFCGRRTYVIHTLHKKYSTAVRIGPSEISFALLSALRQIYGAGSGFERTDFYRMFDVYGRQNLFTFGSVQEHGQRKKLLHHVYSKGVILNSSGQAIQARAQQFLRLVQTKADIDIYSPLLFYSLDNITHFLYGQVGETAALEGNKLHQQMLDDQRDPRRRKMAWFATHARWYVSWLIKQTGMIESLLDKAGLFPQRKPFVYAGIREHAMNAFHQYKSLNPRDGTIIGLLRNNSDLDDLDIASECADHFLAGISTTSDTLLFLLWAMSRPENCGKQERLIQELRDAGLKSIPSPKDLVAAHIPYFEAVITETLLYAPLPVSEPRVYQQDVEIDGLLIPGGTTVSCQVYTLHRNPDAFKDPETFMPERWLSKDPDLKRWWWAFSSGGRMCIGEQLFPLVFYPR
jgi:Cytochrome P450